MRFSLFYLFNLSKFIKDTNFKFNDNYLFYKTSKLHLKLINESKFINTSIKLDFKNKTSKIKNGIIQNYNFKNNYFRKVRLSYFKSDDKQMFNSIWYPSYDYECPILTLDLVNFGTNKSLIFLNLIEIYDDKQYINLYIDPLVKIKKDYIQFNEKLPNYLTPYNNFLSKSLLYAKLNETELNNLLPEILEKYFNKYLNYFIKKPINRYFIEDKHIEYNNFRKTIDIDFMPKEYFDNDWYKRLINENYGD